MLHQSLFVALTLSGCASNIGDIGPRRPIGKLEAFPRARELPSTLGCSMCSIGMPASAVGVAGSRTGPKLKLEDNPLMIDSPANISLPRDKAESTV